METMISGKRLTEIVSTLEAADAIVVIEPDSYLVSFRDHCHNVDRLVPLVAELTFLHRVSFFYAMSPMRDCQTCKTISDLKRLS